MTSPALIADQLTKTYRNGVQALAGVSFQVAPGEIFGLLGPNGAGKSTTVRILATLTQPDGGSARIGGHDVMQDPQAVRRTIGYVAQASGVDRWAKGRENLVLQAQLQRVPADKIDARVDELLAWVNLTEAAGRLVNTYSGGMKRRLDIAMGLVHSPSLLFLDEPTTGLDPETRAALWRDLRRLREERGLSVLLTTHYLEEADAMCDRLAIVDHGKVVAEGTPDDLKRAIGGDRIVIETAEPDHALVLLRAVAGVSEAERDGNLITLRVDHAPTIGPALVASLTQSGLTAISLNIARTTLDDVYLHHTGHRFDAQAVSGGKVGASR